MLCATLCRYDEGTARVHTPVTSPVVIAASTPTGQDAFSGQIYSVRVSTTLARMAVWPYCYRYAANWLPWLGAAFRNLPPSHRPVPQLFNRTMSKEELDVHRLQAQHSTLVRVCVSSSLTLSRFVNHAHGCFALCPTLLQFGEEQPTVEQDLARSPETTKPCAVGDWAAWAPCCTLDW